MGFIDIDIPWWYLLFLYTKPGLIVSLPVTIGFLMFRPQTYADRRNGDRLLCQLPWWGLLVFTALIGAGISVLVSLTAGIWSSSPMGVYLVISVATVIAGWSILSQEW